MFKCNLSSILQKRNLKLEDLLDLGIPLHELNALDLNNIQNIRIKTIDKLCTQIGVKPEELFSYVPFYLKLDHINHYPKTDKLEFVFEIKDNGKTMHCLIYGNYIYNSSEKELNIITNLTEPGQYSEVQIKNDTFLQILKGLQADFMVFLELDICNVVMALINIKTIKSFNFRWPIKLGETI